MIGGKSTYSRSTQNKPMHYRRRLRSLIKTRRVSSLCGTASVDGRTSTAYTIRPMNKFFSFPSTTRFSQATHISVCMMEPAGQEIAGLDIPTQIICCYPNHPMFVEHLQITLPRHYKFRALQRKIVDILFSVIRSTGKLFKREIRTQIHVEETVRAILKLKGIGIFGSRFLLSSRSDRCIGYGVAA